MRVETDNQRCPRAWYVTTCPGCRGKAISHANQSRSTVLKSLIYQGIPWPMIDRSAYYVCKSQPAWVSNGRRYYGDCTVWSMPERWPQ